MELVVVEDDHCEREVIERVQQGSKEDFRVLVVAYQSRVFAAIVRQGIESGVAKELTQEVFLKAYLHIGSFRFEASFATWLLRIAVNHTNSYFTSKRFRQKQATIPLQSSWHEQQSDPYAADRFDREALERLRAVVMQLPPKYREVLVLCGFEQRSYREVSALLGIPVGTVRSRLHKARCKAKELYFQQQD